MQTLRRNAKNFAYNYSEAQKAAREATSNSSVGPTTQQMIVIADYMRDSMGFDEVITVLWKRLNDSGKNWRHVFKSLCVLDFLIKAGNENVATHCRSNIYAIETLRDFQHVEEGRDQGIHIRDKAKQLVALLASGKVGNDAATSSSDAIRMQPRGDEQPIRRPTNVTEEQEQIRLAIEKSLQEQVRSETMKDEYEIRLQQAIEESKKEAEKAMVRLAEKPERFELTGKPKSNVDDLLSLGDLNINQQPSSSLAWYNTEFDDPWAAPPPQMVTPVPQSITPSQIIGLDTDPWQAGQPSVYAPYSVYDVGVAPSETPYTNTTKLHSYADPFSTNPYDTLVDYEKQNNTNLAQSSSNFLGVGGNVDVDSLVQLDGIGSSNPFLTSNIEAKRTPTLNELRAQQQSYPTPPISPFPSSIPPSQMPPISSTNPFASAF